MKTTSVALALLCLILPVAPIVQIAPAHADGVAATDHAVAADNNPTPTDKPFLWMVDTTPPAFLYGTIHLPDRRVLAEPAMVTAAFDAAEALYTEIPMDREAMAGAMVAFQLTEGQTLTGLLSEELSERADAYLKERGLALAMLNQMTPIAVSV
ncbi:MAG: TraB/GumN family protein, partial [Gemmatimonadetes bacterium]|nr:TraB/GumN family protein [Gemmatimonadota bacterium]